jgi:hypothetical protein
VNVVDANLTTRSKVNKEQLFQEKEPKKKKKCCWLGERKAIEEMVETIQ